MQLILVELLQEFAQIVAVVFYCPGDFACDRAIEDKSLEQIVIRI